MKSVFAFLFLIFTSQISAQTITGNYAIKNVQTGLLLKIKDANTDNGTPLVAYYPENWKCMTWNFKHSAGNTYQLQNLYSNKTFQAATNANPGVALEEQALKADAKNQQYEFISIKKDVYKIRLSGTDLFVTIADPKRNVNSAIILSSDKNSPEQWWTIYEQSPTM